MSKDERLLGKILALAVEFEALACEADAFGESLVSATWTEAAARLRSLL